jgi:hypothetical protein
MHHQDNATLNAIASPASLQGIRKRRRSNRDMFQLVYLTSRSRVPCHGSSSSIPRRFGRLFALQHALHIVHHILLHIHQLDDENEVSFKGKYAQWLPFCKFPRRGTRGKEEWRETQKQTLLKACLSSVLLPLVSWPSARLARRARLHAATSNLVKSCILCSQEETEWKGCVSSGSCVTFVLTSPPKTGGFQTSAVLPSALKRGNRVEKGGCGLCFGGRCGMLHGVLVLCRQTGGLFYSKVGSTRFPRGNETPVGAAAGVISRHSQENSCKRTLGPGDEQHREEQKGGRGGGGRVAFC